MTSNNDSQNSGFRNSENGGYRNSTNFSKIEDLTENINLYGYSRFKNIGSSDFSKVFAALHTSTNNLVALKFFQSTFIKDPVKIQQYIKENVAAGRLNHINIAKVFEAGKLDALDYIAMEFLYGRNLKSIMNDVKILNPYLASDIILRVALALEHANDNALIHKGIKLENIMILDQTKNLKLQGFGLAHYVNTEISENVDFLLDSLKYASPEQAAEKAIDFRSDIYSLGVCYYFLVTGKYPFVSDNPEVMIAMHKDALLIAPSKIRYELDENIEKTIIKMLNKKPEDRFNSYSSLISNLTEILEITDLQTYIDSESFEHSAIAVEHPVNAIPLASTLISLNNQLVDIEDDEIEEIEEIGDNEIEEIEEIDEKEIEEISGSPNAPKFLKKPPKKLKSGLNTGVSASTKTEIGRVKHKTTHLLNKGTKSRIPDTNDRESKTGKHGIRHVNMENVEPDRIKQKRRPENVEKTTRRREKTAASAQAKTAASAQAKTAASAQAQKADSGKAIPTISANVKTPTKIQKIRNIKDAKPLQKAPPPLISPNKRQPIPIQNQQSKISDNEPDVIFPELIHEHLLDNNNQFVHNIPNENSVEFLESKTSSGKYSKAPKVPSGGGDKIRLNLGTITLDSSSKISNPDESSNSQKNNINNHGAEEVEIEEMLDEITDFENIDLSSSEDDTTPDTD